jgi:hypothetical protein
MVGAVGSNNGMDEYLLIKFIGVGELTRDA